MKNMTAREREREHKKHDNEKRRKGRQDKGRENGRRCRSQRREGVGKWLAINLNVSGCCINTALILLVGALGDGGEEGSSRRRVTVW